MNIHPRDPRHPQLSVDSAPLTDPAGSVPERVGEKARIILYCAADLLWATKIKSTGDGLKILCRPARNLEMLAARLADSAVLALLVDLESGPAALDLITHLRRPDATPAERAVIIVAFGPHVDTAALAAAQQAGANAVLARGAFAGQLPDLLVRLANGPGAPIKSQLTD